MINNVSLVGRITHDPELKKTQSGHSVVSFSLAVNRTFNKEEQDADFINIVAWRHSADFVANYVTKGDLLGVTGRIETRNYENSKGERVYVTEVIADSVQALESRKEKEARQDNFTPEETYADDINDEFGGPTLDISSDDLPF